MLINNPPPKPKTHQKSHSYLPTLSLGQLQKKYHSIKQHHRKPIDFLNSVTFKQQSSEDIKITSPFYDRTNCNMKQHCRCQYHKRIRSQAMSLTRYPNRNPKPQNITNHPTYTPLQTLPNDPNPTIKKHRRFKSDASDLSPQPHSNQRHKLLIEANKQLYKQFLKNLKESQISNVDCYNYQFEEFLKSHDKWLLTTVKRKDSIASTTKEPGQRKNRNRYKTAPEEGGEDEGEQEMRMKYGGQNVMDVRKAVRRKHKHNTDLMMMFKASDQDSMSQTKSAKYFTCGKDSGIMGLKDNNRKQLQAFLTNAFKDLGLPLPPTTPASPTNFFSSVCKNLLNPSSPAFQQAKKVLKRMSRLPLQLYGFMMKQIKQQLKSGNPQLQNTMKPNELESCVNLAFQTIEAGVEESVRQKEETKGREKLSMLGRLKRNFVGRRSMNVGLMSGSKGFDGKARSRYSSSVDGFSSGRSQDGKRSRFAGDKTNSKFNGIDSLNPVISQFSCQNSPTVTNNTQCLNSTASQPHNPTTPRRQPRRLQNLKKFLKPSTLMKTIQQQIQYQNNRKLPLPLKPQPSPQYQQSLAQSRRRFQQQEYIKHMQFLNKMNQKQHQRQSSTMSECEMKKNTLRAHYQRHKLFIKRMEVALANSEALKEVVINFQDDLFTKKRKVRLLKNMVMQCQEKEAEFCRDIRKYVEIFEKNCNMVVAKERRGLFDGVGGRRKTREDSCILIKPKPTPQPNTTTQLQPFITSLKTDLSLKFYSITYTPLQDQDTQTPIKQLPTSQSSKLKHETVDRVVWHATKQHHEELMKRDSSVLVQMGLGEKVNDVVDVGGGEVGDGEVATQDMFKQMTSKQLQRLILKFQKNMQRYKKVLIPQNKPNLDSTLQKD